MHEELKQVHFPTVRDRLAPRRHLGISAVSMENFIRPGALLIERVP